MPGNRSLDEFADAAEEAGGADEQAVGADVTEADVTGTPSADATDAGAPGEPDAVQEGELDGSDPPVEPPVSTYVWTPDGGPCDACGESVEERWRDGQDLVCAACKEW